MKVVIRMSKAEQEKALPILFRHSPGTVLPNDIYVIAEDAATALRDAGVHFTELSRESRLPQRRQTG